MLLKVWATVLVAIAALLAADFAESTAEAKLLKNGVRPGDRSKMHIVRKPSAGTRKRINAPGETRTKKKPTSKPEKKKTTTKKKKDNTPAVAKRATKPKPRYKQRHGWFWKQHSPTLGAAGESRWEDALSTMTGRRESGKGLVRDSSAREVMGTYHGLVTAAAARTNVSEGLLAAVIIVESAGRASAVSPKGARGLMQLIPATAQRFGVTDTFDPAQNIIGGATYLDWLLKEFRGDPLLALAAYNSGENAVRRHKGVPPYAETRDYVVKVMDAMAALQRLCPAAAKGPRGRCPAPRAPALPKPRQAPETAPLPSASVAPPERPKAPRARDGQSANQI